MRALVLALSLALLFTTAACGGSSSPTLPDAGGDDAAVTPQDDAAPQDDAGQDDAAPACSQPPRQFWTYDLSVMPPTYVQVGATCRGETAHGYVFVADDMWGTKLDQAAVTTIMQAFETATPADPSRGMYQIDTQTFGDPPDVDSNPHLYLLYAKMAGYGGYTFDGYFRDDEEVAGPTSDLLEMVELNADDAEAPTSDYMLGVLIHELVHLIAYRYDANEEAWLSEALAESAMTMGGYMTDLAAGRATARAAATTALVVNPTGSGGGVDYGAVFLFGSYLYERFGATLLRALVQDPGHGIASVDAQLTSLGSSFRELFGDFMLANLLDQPAIGDGRYGYTSFDLTTLGHETAGVIGGASQTVTPAGWGAQYLRFTPTGAGTLTVTVASADYAKLEVRAATFDPAHPETATVTSHAITSASEDLTFTVTAGQVVDLSLAVYWGTTLGAQPTATVGRVSVAYTASFAP